MYKTTEINTSVGTVFVTTTSHEEPYFYYETGNYFVSDEGETSSFELYRRTDDEHTAEKNHSKLVEIVRDTERSYQERLAQRWDK